VLKAEYSKSVSVIIVILEAPSETQDSSVVRLPSTVQTGGVGSVGNWSGGKSRVTIVPLGTLLTGRIEIV
jgi:hypothetical protein